MELYNLRDREGYWKHSTLTYLPEPNTPSNRPDLSQRPESIYLRQLERPNLWLFGDFTCLRSLVAEGPHTCTGRIYSPW